MFKRELRNYCKNGNVFNSEGTGYDVAHRNVLKKNGKGNHQFTRTFVHEKLNLIEEFIDELASWVIQQQEDEDVGF